MADVLDEAEIRARQAEAAAHPAPEAPQAAAAPEKDAVIAVIDLGGMIIGVPVVNLREVVRAPEKFDLLPSTQTGVVGCFELRQQIIPVIDLMSFVELGSGRGEADEAAGSVVVLTYEGQLVGLRARAALRLLRESECTLQETNHNQSFKAAAILGTMAANGGVVFPILNIESLYRDAIPVVRDGRKDRRDWNHSDRFLLFETDGLRMCLPITQIQNTIPYSEVDKWTARSDLCCGTVRGYGIEVALADPLALLGLRATARELPASPSILVRIGEGERVALRIDRVLDIVRLSDETLSPVPTSVYRRPELIKGIVSRSDTDQYVVLDHDALLVDERFKSLGKLLITRQTEEASKARGTGQAVMSVVVNAGKSFGIDLANVVEIMPWRDRFDAENKRDFFGTINHRHDMVPVYSLSRLMGGGTQPYGHKASIIILTRGAEKFGLAVQELIAVEGVYPEKMALFDRNLGAKTRMARRAGQGAKELIQMVETETMPLPAPDVEHVTGVAT